MKKSLGGFYDMRPYILVNKAHKQFICTHDVCRTTKRLSRNLVLLKKSSTAEDIERQIDLLGEIIVSCLGALEALGCDTQEILRKLAR
jgi:hypothetical protein